MSHKKEVVSAEVDSISPLNARMNVLKTLANTIAKLEYRYQHGRITDEKKEKIKTDQARAIIYGCNVTNAVLKDFELSEVIYTLNEIKEAINNPNISPADASEVTADRLDMVEKTLKIMED